MRCNVARAMAWVLGVGVGIVANAASAAAQTPADTAAAWPQFRGPNGTGVSRSAKAPPIEFAPGRNELWTTPLPAGHSSPVIWGDRIFLTAFDAGRNTLEVLAVSRTTGEIAWRRAVAADGIERVHPVSNPATATPVVDAERVYVYFGSVGLLAFGHDGTPRWTVPLPLATVPNGSGTSPILAGELVILNRVEPTAPFIAAYDRRTGAPVWKQPHQVLPMPGGFVAWATPAIVGKEVVVHGPNRVQGYDLASGALRWWAVVSSTGTSTPVVDDGTIYVTTWSHLGDVEQRYPLPTYAALLKHDADADGILSESELPDDVLITSRPDTAAVPGATLSIRRALGLVDGNKDRRLSPQEWDGALALFKAISVDHGLVAIGTGGTGDVTKTQIRWQVSQSTPEVPSPLSYRGRVYMVRNGGILTSVDAATGRVVYRGRVGAGGPYYASPVAVGNRVFLTSGDGVVSVLEIGDELKIIARNDLGEAIFASPAVVDGVLYVRTTSGMRAFGAK